MKKLISIVLALALILSLGVTAFAAEDKNVTITYREIKILINGERINPKDATGASTEPFILDGSTFLPVRAVAGALGLEVGWDAETSTVYLDSGAEPTLPTGTPAASKGDKKATITYRDIKIVIDGTEIIPTDATGAKVEPFILNGTTYLPVRAVSGALGLEVGWDAETSTVTLDSDGQPTTPPVKSTFSIHFIDVGQADAALVECDGHYMLIDGGNKADSNRIYSVLSKAQVKKLDIVVGTHAHEDHIGGIPGAYNYTTADLTLCPVTSYSSDAFSDFARYANQKGGGITVPDVGDTYTLGSSDITILGVNGGSDVNDTSIVLKIEYGDTSFLFTGDAEREAEQAVLNTGADLSATLLKVGHHGSDSSTTYHFLREIMPKYAIISVGEDNSYGHPTDDALSRLRDAGVKVYRTDLQGDIYVTSDGKTVSVSTSYYASDAEIMVPGEEEVTTDPGIPDTVYVTPTGKRYHYLDTCAGKNAIPRTLGEAIASGYTPCKTCVQ